MKPGIVYVWSSGLEQWEETGLPFSSTIQYKFYLYSKKIGKGTLQIFKDTENRYLGIFHDES
jgi:hypothetical protein